MRPPAPLTYAEATTGSSGRNARQRDPQGLRHSFHTPGSPHLGNRSGEERESSRHIPQDTKPYRDYAAGGFVESDKNLVALAEREAAEARSRQLEKENFAALFSDPGDDVLVDSTEKMQLVRTISDGEGGSRGVWKGYLSTSQNANSSKKEEASLLDL